jgi:hypothetical protein
LLIRHIAKELRKAVDVTVPDVRHGRAVAS